MRTLNLISNILFLILAVSELSGQSEKQVIDRVIATVGGEIILYSEIQEQVAYAKQQNPDLPESYACMALQSALVERMLVNQAKLDSVLVSDEEVETQLNARVDRLLVYFNQDQKALEEYYGQSIDQIKNSLRNDMRNQLLATRMQDQITSKATITPSEVKAFFNNIPADSLPYFNAEVEIREILYKPRISEAERKKAKEKAEELRKRIVENGESFAELARKYSDDPGSGQAGGDLGWQKRGTFVSDFEAAVYNLEKSQISQLVETEFGFHVIQLIERRGNLVHCRHILIKPEVTDEDLEAAEQLLDSVRQLLLTNRLTFTEAVKKFGDENTASYNNDGRVSNPRTGNSFFEIADLDTDVFFAIDGIEIGQVTEPIPLRAPTGERYYRLVELVSRSKPHKANLQEDYNKIQQAALEQKKAEFTEKWVIEKLQNTYLTVGENYRDCESLQILIKNNTAIRP
ncbi:MAG: peptidylprolyl isomerase [Saprospiraceae bacterium]|nr:peptidylprolyl isomerase [Saprospiraceae bacterium]